MNEQEARRADGSMTPDRFVLDLSDRKTMRTILERVRPDVVIHLAAIAFVPDGGDPTAMDIVNHLATRDLAAAMQDIIPQSHLLFVSSAEVFGRVSEEFLPFTEQSPEQPINSYGKSKLAAEQAIRSFESHLSWTIVRPFNHIGPGQNERFVIPAWCKQLVEIQRGNHAPVLRVGNIDVSKDFTDVRDVVRAYADIVAHRTEVAHNQMYVIGSGKAVALRDILSELLSIAGLSERVSIEVDPERYRPEAFPIVYGSADKVRTQLGWSPSIPLKQTLQECLNEMRERASLETPTR